MIQAFLAATSKLPRLGPNAALRVDGIFGPRTFEAVKLFQRSARTTFGLSDPDRVVIVDGIVGPQTLDLMLRAWIIGTTYDKG